MRQAYLNFLFLTGAAFGLMAEPNYRIVTYWDASEQRVGTGNVLHLRIESSVPPKGTVEARLALPDGIEYCDTEDLTKAMDKWKRGEVFANSILHGYFEFTEKPEKRLHTTTSWDLYADTPVTGEAKIILTGLEPEPMEVTVSMDFKAAPVDLEIGAIPEPEPVPHDYHIGALYYPGWEPGLGSGWDLLEPFPERRPELGYYDGGTVETANWEIKWAAENGINFFVYCWYLLPGQSASVDNLFLGRALHEGYMHSPFRENLDFAILWENAENRGDSSAEFFREELVPFWIEHYFNHEGYLRIEGKPVFFIYDINRMIAVQGGVEQAAESIQYLRDKVAEAGMPGIWIVGEARAKEEHLHFFHRMKKMRLDASFAYSYMFPEPVYDQEAVAAILDVYDTQVEISPVPIIPTASVSWDPQPWVEYIDYIWHSVPFWLDPPHFQSLLGELKTRLDNRESGNPLTEKMLLIDNWNEFAEGHWVAPSKKAGFGYLNAIREVFAPSQDTRLNVMLEDVGMEPDESGYRAWKEKLLKQAEAKATE